MVWRFRDIETVVTGAELVSLAAAARVLGATVIDNTWGRGSGTGGYRYGYVEALLKFASAPTGSDFALYAIPAVDGTNYADGAAAVVPQDELKIGTLLVKATANPQRLVLPMVELPPCLFKICAYNNSGVALSAVAGDHSIKLRRLGPIWK